MDDPDIKVLCTGIYVRIVNGDDDEGRWMASCHVQITKTSSHPRSPRNYRPLWNETQENVIIYNNTDVLGGHAIFHLAQTPSIQIVFTWQEQNISYAFSRSLARSSWASLIKKLRLSVSVLMLIDLYERLTCTTRLLARQSPDATDYVHQAFLQWEESRTAQDSWQGRSMQQSIQAMPPIFFASYDISRC